MKALIILLFSLQVWAQENATQSLTLNVKDNASRDMVVGGKPLRFNFFNLSSVKTSDFDRGGSSIGSYNYLGITYRLTPVSSVGFRYVFFYDSPGFKFNPATRKEENIGHRLSQGDPYISYSRYDVAQFGGWNLGGQTRYYMPLSKFSKAQKTNGQVRLETYLDRGVGRFDSFSYIVKFDYYLQTQTAFVDEEIPRYNDGKIPNYAIKTTRQMALEHYLEYEWSVSRYYSIVPKVGFDENWYHGSAAENLDASHMTEAKIALGTELRLVRSLNMILSLENTTKLTNLREGEEVRLGRPENNEIVALTSYRF